ncbi:class I SAM-dependent DNA methyltransferase [Brevibacillus choshinensis]|uniref:HsdM family class I SAM-dependent methyltransferase n=1 Tax=Brevibacillus choshinensis TaxID=54911 RepID=UPI002E24EC88|nr:N-6 DNA methylase [Brevibacillus choshinensis]MED4779525.1 N-6 DNA methylase [Brevibacillus choshinensis]
MGKRERKRYEQNEQVIALLKKPTWTEEEDAFVREHYTGYGGLSHSGDGLGQFYTPKAVADFVVNLLAIPSGSVVAEPACGAGVFLSSLPSDVTVHACELAPEASAVASRLYPHADVRTGDGITFLRENKETFDFIVGNPPYGGTILADSRFSNKQGKVSPELVFLEAALGALKPGGKLAMIVPDGLLSAQKYQSFRKWVIEEFRLWASISLPAETFYFAGTGCKTSILVIEKPATSKPQDIDSFVFMAMVEKIGWDSRGRLTESDLPKIFDAWKRFYSEHQEPMQNQVPEVTELTILLGEDGQYSLDIAC